MKQQEVGRGRWGGDSLFVIIFLLKLLYEIRFPLARSVVVYVSIRIFLLKVHWLAYMIYYDWKCDSPMNNLLVVCHNFLKGREVTLPTLLLEPLLKIR